MEIKEFAEIIREELESRTGLEVTAKEVRKNNNTVLHGICISEPGCNVVPTIYLESYYEAYESGVSLRAIIEKIYELYKTGKPRVSFDTNWFMDWERVKGSIGFRLINYNSNKELLKEIPHTRFLDLAKVYYVVVESKEFGSGTILIYNSHSEVWGVTTEQLEAIAAENTPKLSPLSISSMNDMMAELVGEEGVIELPEDYQLFILTNNKRIFGATTLCNRKALRELAEKLDSDLLIFPSSVHEIIVKPASGNLEEFLNSRDMVREVNQTLVAQEEILSDSVNFYSKETNTLSIA